MYDLIGDVHGHHDKLEALLLKLGYDNKKGTYSHPERKVLFVGDYIDRGPKIRETLEIVKRMVDNGNAIALMGNHEYNALCFHFRDTNGEPLREHSKKNVNQHDETLTQFQDRQKEFKEYLDWFLTLPLFYETENFRAVHACWDHENIKYLGELMPDGKLRDALIYESAKKGSKLYHAIDVTLKGKEMKMPNGNTFEDKDGAIRSEIRIKWWENPIGSTFKSISVVDLDNLLSTPVDFSTLGKAHYYKEDEKPVFFGHYWLNGEPSLYRNNVCCLDYSVAKNGKLVAYRLDEERELGDGKLVWV